jgi:hypothetical protein
MPSTWNARRAEGFVPRLFDADDDESSEPTCERTIPRETIDAMMREADRAEREDGSIGASFPPPPSASGCRRIRPEQRTLELGVRDTQPDLAPLGLLHAEHVEDAGACEVFVLETLDELAAPDAIEDVDVEWLPDEALVAPTEARSRTDLDRTVAAELERAFSDSLLLAARSQRPRPPSAIPFPIQSPMNGPILLPGARAGRSRWTVFGVVLALITLAALAVRVLTAGV